MTMRRLLLQFAAVLAVLAAANAVVASLARNSVPRQKLRSVDSSPPATDAFLGNSLMDAGFDGAAFSSAKPGRPLNAAIGATEPVEHLLMYRRLAGGRHDRADIYYGFFDTQLTDSPRGSFGGLVGNRALSYYVEPEVALAFYEPDSAASRTKHRVVRCIPMLVERQAVWANVERLRRVLAGLGMPQEATNRFGRVSDFGMLESSVDDFDRACEAGVSMPLCGPVAEILRSAAFHGSHVYVIEMPMPSSHRKQFYIRPAWARYRDHLIQSVANAGGSYVSAADWVGDEGFADHLHLNEAGAREFSLRLGRLAANGTLAPSVTSPAGR